MPTPNFTLAHLRPLQQHIQSDGAPRRLTHVEPMTDLERDCCEWGLLSAHGFVTSITAAGLALVQAIELQIDHEIEMLTAA